MLQSNIKYCISAKKHLLKLGKYEKRNANNLLNIIKLDA